MAASGDILVPEWLIPKPPYEQRPELEHPDPEHERRWKDSVWLRDQGYCRWCKKFEEFVHHVEVHHLTYERFGREETDDGCLLCNTCHDFVTGETRRRRSMQR